MAITEEKRNEQVTKAKDPDERLDTASQALFAQLSERRKNLAKEHGLPAYRIASNIVLEGLARRRPLTNEELLEVKGLGVKLRDKYGAEWLEVIALFMSANDTPSLHTISVDTSVVVSNRDTTPSVRTFYLKPLR